MYKCKPERSVAQTVLLMAVSVLLTGGVFALSAVWKENAGLIRFIGFFCLALCIYVIYRFTLTEMEYTLCDGYFTVTRIVGRKRTDVAVLDLAESVALVTREEYRSGGLNKGLSAVFNYSQNLGGRHWVDVFTFQDKRGSVEFEPNDAFAAIFQVEIEKAKNRTSGGGDPDGEPAVL